MLASSDGISSWTPLKPQHSKPNLWPINSGVLTSLLLPHLSSSLTDSLPSLNLLCHTKTDAWFMQNGWKAVWSIPYVSVAFFASLEHNFIAYRSSKVSDCIFEIQQLWQSGFSRVYSNCCCSCSSEPEILKIGQTSHKMYSNNILNFQESTTILNACTKKVWKLIECTTYLFKNYPVSQKCSHSINMVKDQTSHEVKKVKNIQYWYFNVYSHPLLKISYCNMWHSSQTVINQPKNL